MQNSMVSHLERQLLEIFPKEFFLEIFPEGGWLVGGAVRNTILQRPIKDFDIKVSLSFEEIVAHVQQHGLELTQNIDLQTHQYYINKDARTVSVLLNGIDVDINSTMGKSLEELISLGDINFNCCAFCVKTGKILTPEFILPIQYRMLRFCNKERALKDPLIIVNALKQVSLMPRVYLPPLTLQTIKLGLASVAEMLRFPSLLDYKLLSFMGNINSQEVYELFPEEVDIAFLLSRFDLSRIALRVPAPYKHSFVADLSHPQRSKIEVFLQKLYAGNFKASKLFSPMATVVAWLEDGSGELVSLIIMEGKRIYSIGARNKDALVSLVTALVRNNVGLWGTIDVTNTMIQDIAFLSGMYIEESPSIVDKILRYGYPKYGNGLEIDVHVSGHTVFTDPETGYSQVLVRN